MEQWIIFISPTREVLYGWKVSLLSYNMYFKSSANFLLSSHEIKRLTASAIWLSQHREHWFFIYLYIYNFSIWELDKCVAKRAYDDD